MNKLVINLFKKMGFEPIRPTEKPEIPNFENIVRGCSREQLNALVYKALEVAAKDGNKKDLLGRWSKKAASYISKSSKNPWREAPVDKQGYNCLDKKRANNL